MRVELHGKWMETLPSSCHAGRIGPGNVRAHAAYDDDDDHRHCIFDAWWQAMGALVVILFIGSGIIHGHAWSAAFQW